MFLELKERQSYIMEWVELSFEEKSFWELRYDVLDISDILTFLKKILALDLELREKLRRQF